MNRIMKETNIPWIGQIPEDWQVRQVKQAFNICKEKANDKNPVVLSLARDSVKIRDISNNEGQLAESYKDYNPVKVGDLLLNPMDLYSGANCNISEVEGVISPAYSKLRAKVDLEPRFFDYYFKTQYWTMAMFAHGKGVSFDNRWTLSNDTLKGYYLPFPSKDEQVRIVKAIKSKEEKINALIANEEKQIKRLRAYKQALISEAVTKGLDPSAPMKDSGVEWIGKIPNIWNITRIKDLFNVYAGSTPASGEPKYYNGEVVWVTPADYKTDDVYIYDSAKKLTECGLKSCHLNLVDKGSLIVSKRAPIGTVSIAGVDLCTNQGCLSCVPKSSRIFTKYYYYVLSIASEALNVLGSGTTFKEISYSNFGKFAIPLPSYDTQFSIAKALDDENLEITRLLKTHCSKIALLKEYRQSLIYEYVTGKREAK